MIIYNNITGLMILLIMFILPPIEESFPKIQPSKPIKTEKVRNNYGN